MTEIDDEIGLDMNISTPSIHFKPYHWVYLTDPSRTHQLNQFQSRLTRPIRLAPIACEVQARTRVTWPTHDHSTSSCPRMTPKLVGPDPTQSTLYGPPPIRIRHH